MKTRDEHIEAAARRIRDTPEAAGEYVEHMQVIPSLPYDMAEAFAEAALASFLDQIERQTATKPVDITDLAYAVARKLCPHPEPESRDDYGQYQWEAYVERARELIAFIHNALGQTAENPAGAEAKRDRDAFWKWAEINPPKESGVTGTDVVKAWLGGIEYARTQPASDGGAVDEEKLDTLIRYELCNTELGLDVLVEDIIKSIRPYLRHASPALPVEDEREAFEALWSDQPILERDRSGIYQNDQVRNAWFGYRHGRANERAGLHPVAPAGVVERIVNAACDFVRADTMVIPGRSKADTVSDSIIELHHAVNAYHSTQPALSTTKD